MSKIKLSNEFIEYLKSKNCSIEEIEPDSVKINYSNVNIFINLKKFNVKVYIKNIEFLLSSVLFRDENYENLQDAEKYIMKNFENFKEIGFIFWINDNIFNTRAFLN